MVKPLVMSPCFFVVTLVLLGLVLLFGAVLLILVVTGSMLVWRIRYYERIGNTTREC